MPATNIITLAADVPQAVRKTPFLTGQPMALSTHTGTPTVYGANLPGKTDDNYNVTDANGTDQIWNETDLPALASAHDDAGALTTATSLRVIAMLDGVAKKRVVSSTPTPSLAADTFKIQSNGLAANAALVLADNPSIGDNFFFTDTSGNAGVIEFIGTGVATTGTVGCVIGTGVAITAANLVAAVNSVGMTAKITATTATTTGGTNYRIPLYQDIGGATGNTAVTYSGTNLSGANFTGGTNDGFNLVLAAAPTVGTKLEVAVLESTDITTYNSGALTANIRYEATMKDVVIASAIARLEKLFN